MRAPCFLPRKAAEAWRWVSPSPRCRGTPSDKLTAAVLRPQAQAYCRKPVKIRGCSAPPAVRFAVTMMLPSALMPPVCTMPLDWVSVSPPVGVTEYVPESPLPTEKDPLLFSV